VFSGLFSCEFAVLTSERFVGLGFCLFGANSVAVLEADIDEDEGAVLGQDEIDGVGGSVRCGGSPCATTRA